MPRNYMQDLGRSKDEPHLQPERSIRNITPSRRRAPRETPPLEESEHPMPPMPSGRRRSRFGMWIVAGLSVLLLVGAALAFLLPKTTVTVIPRTQIVPFDAGTAFTVHPEGTQNQITYSTLSQEFEESSSVPASGTEEVNEKASGTITVYNEYSSAPVRLIKNTRFQSEGGQIFRIPGSVDVPGKSGANPGTIEITVFADGTGESYNVPPGSFTLPGLKTTPKMFSGVYGKSTKAFTGGFSGTRPSVPQATLENAQSALRERLREKISQLEETAPAGSLVFPGLSSITYETLPPTIESGGTVRIHEKARVVVPAMSETQFSQALALAMSANAEGHTIQLKLANNIVANASSTLAEGEYGKRPLTFSLTGSGQLVWSVDATALAEALAGKEEGAFKPIVATFPAIEEARAQIMPFWKKSFPSDPSKLAIKVEEPVFEP